VGYARPVGVVLSGSTLVTALRLFLNLKLGLKPHDILGLFSINQSIVFAAERGRIDDLYPDLGSDCLTLAPTLCKRGQRALDVQ
jgi:hypothetical protein